MKSFEVGRLLVLAGWAYEVTGKDGETVTLEDLTGDATIVAPLYSDDDGEYVLTTDGERIRPNN